ncbi:SGNH/GDSL hydrolase family protein [Modestobacter sp. SYSU DS0511]
MTRYVALGSSFAAGPGIEPILHPGCGRSGRNYAHLVAERLGYDLADVTSGGATVEDVLTRPQALLAGGTVPPQVDAVGPDADLVTVTVGGNDVEYLLTLLRCSFQADPEGAPLPARAFFGTPVDPAAVDAALDELPQRLAGLVGEVRRRAPGRGSCWSTT